MTLSARMESVAMKYILGSFVLWVLVGTVVAQAGVPGNGMSNGAMSNSRSERSSFGDDITGEDNHVAYDQNAVTERYTKTLNGGVLHVVAIESSDAKQIGLIRSVLKQRSQDFAGQYKNSSHQPVGPSKPGLATLLAANPGDLDITYLEVRGGGDLRFTSNVPELVHAIHQWFDAQ